jgi:surfactin synthase thioesterase subunit
VGHSFGSLVALELADMAARKGHKVLLGVSGMSAPTTTYWKEREKISRLPEIEFIEKLKALGEFSADIPAQFLHLIKSDFAMMEDFPLRGRRNVPALVFGGTLDPLTSEERLAAWSELVDLKRPPLLYVGNHFQFFINHIEPIIKELTTYI